MNNGDQEMIRPVHTRVLEFWCITRCHKQRKEHKRALYFERGWNNAMKTHCDSYGLWESRQPLPLRLQ